MRIETNLYKSALENIACKKIAQVESSSISSIPSLHVTAAFCHSCKATVVEKQLCIYRRSHSGLPWNAIAPANNGCRTWSTSSSRRKISAQLSQFLWIFFGPSRLAMASVHPSLPDAIFAKQWWSQSPGRGDIMDSHHGCPKGQNVQQKIGTAEWC